MLTPLPNPFLPDLGSQIGLDFALDAEAFLDAIALQAPVKPSTTKKNTGGQAKQDRASRSSSHSIFDELFSLANVANPAR